MVHLRENKGMLLITTFMVTTVIFVLSGAYIAGTITQNNAVRRQNDSLAAFYNAGRGIEYAFVEAQNSGYAWVTHQVATTDLDGNGQIDDLVKVASPPAPTLQVEGATPTIDSDGNYYIASVGLKLKAYYDPTNPNEIIVLSQATTGSSTRLVKFRISQRSLYRYFYYFSNDKMFHRTSFDGKGEGAIYVNGNIYLDIATFTNIKELSTNTQGAIYTKFPWLSQYKPPYEIDDLDGSRDGMAVVPSLVSPLYKYDINGDPYYGWWGRGGVPPGTWKNVTAYFTNPGSVNGVDLPGSGTESLLSTYWNWDKYYGDNYGEGSAAGELPVRFYFPDANGNPDPTQPVDAAYWNNLLTIAGGNPAYFDSAFWNDKVYDRTSTTETESVNYLNTDQQASDWQNWLTSKDELIGVIKEKSTGGYDLGTPVNIETNYSNLAKQNGLYVEDKGGGNFYLCLNGSCSTRSLPSYITPKEFYNALRPKTTISEGVSTYSKENVLEINVRNAPAINNSIVYIANRNSRLVNGSQLPNRGLVVVSPYNVYIKGDYNSVLGQWQPSAVITNSLVYVLSSSFNDPQQLPALRSPREWPYVLNWIKTDNNLGIPLNQLLTSGTADQKVALEQEIISFFGLSSFSLGGVTTESGLETAIRNRYSAEYNPSASLPKRTPNRAQNTVVKVAIASPYDVSAVMELDQAYMLEDWSGRPLSIEGAFIQLGGSWANDADGNPIRDVPPVPVYKRTGGPNSQGENPTTMSSFGIWTFVLPVNPAFEYEEQFAEASRRPSGDFFTGSQPRWEELDATSDNFTHHKL